jgi:hypothetical protein
VVEMLNVEADLNGSIQLPVPPAIIDEVDDDDDGTAEEEDGVKDSDDNKAKDSDNGNSKGNEDVYEDISVCILVPREEGSGVVSDASTLDNHDSAVDEFILISRAASGVITESEAADPVCLLFSYTSPFLAHQPRARYQTRHEGNAQGGGTIRKEKK